MNHHSEPQRLLDDVLAEALPPDFRAALLAGTLRQARRRRHWRSARSASAVIVLLLVGILAWQQPTGKISAVRPATKFVTPKNYQLVETQPLPADATVSTKNFATVKMVSTTAGAVQIATRSGGFRLINDEQLLALLHASPAVLIRTGPDSEELVFASLEDRQRLLGN